MCEQVRTHLCQTPVPPPPGSWSVGEHVSTETALIRQLYHSLRKQECCVPSNKGRSICPEGLCPTPRPGQKCGTFPPSGDPRTARWRLAAGSWAGSTEVSAPHLLPKGPPCSGDGVSARRPGCHESGVPAGAPTPGSGPLPEAPAGAWVPLGLGHHWQTHRCGPPEALRCGPEPWTLPGPGCPVGPGPVCGSRVLLGPGWMASGSALAPGLQLLLCLRRLCCGCLVGVCCHPGPSRPLRPDHVTPATGELWEASSDALPVGSWTYDGGPPGR